MGLATAVAINAYEIENVRLKVTKGNGLTDIVLESWQGDQFAKTMFEPPGGSAWATGDSIVMPVSAHGMAMGKEPAKAVRVSKQVAALGARGDFIEFECDVNVLGTTTWAILAHAFMVQMLDFSGVPVAVQHAIFGKYSPFVTPTQPVSQGMIQGIDRQVIEVINNVDNDEDGTFDNMKIRGSADSRVQSKATGATAAVTKLTMKMTPNSDGVFVIPAGAVLWAGYGRDATKSYTVA